MSASPSEMNKGEQSTNPVPTSSSTWVGVSPTVAAVLLVIGATTSLIWFVSPYFDATYRDAPMYVLTAQSMLAGDGYTHLGVPFSLRPPGFSALLVPVLALFGTHIVALNLYVSLFGIFCVVMLFQYARPRLGIGLALAFCAAVWVNPGFQQLCNSVLSDVPAAALILMCLNVERWAQRQPGWRRDLALGLCLAVVAYVRSAALPVVPAIVLSRWLHTRSNASTVRGLAQFGFRRAALLTFVPLLAFVPWLVRNASVDSFALVDQDSTYSYSTAVLHTETWDPNSPLVSWSDMLVRVPRQLGSVVLVVGSRMTDPTLNFAHLALGCLALLCLLFALVRYREAGEVFVCLLLGVIAFLPVLPPRLALPVYLLAFLAATDVMRRGLRKYLRGRFGSAVTVCIVLLLGLFDARPRATWSDLETAQIEIEQVSKYVNERFPQDVVVAAPFGWTLSVFMERPVYGTRWALAREGLPGVQRILDENDVGVVVIIPGEAGDDELIPYLSERYPVDESVGSAKIFTIVSDDE